MHMRVQLGGIARLFVSCREGSVLIETAIILPVLILLLAGAYELGNFMLANQKVAGLSSSMTDLVAQSEDEIQESEINDVFAAMEYISEPFNVLAGGRVIISAFRRDSGNGNTILWQRCKGMLAVASRFGNVGTQNVTLPGNIVLPDGETAVVGEVYYSYAPRLFVGFFDPQQLRAEAVYRPRFGALSNVVADGATPNLCQ